MMFPMEPGERLRSNYLAICVQPDEGIHLRFEAKQPDTAATMRPVDMEFHYADAFDGADIPDAYERLLLDAINGDASLFTLADEIELSWRLMDSILDGWRTDQAPKLAAYLLGRDHHHWTSGCEHD
jgi:glucose-6-phosphate 1-dehydrogenase